ncbi:MAG: hypothetical protein ACRECH_11200 [Nitrososphaerales archaeon]
MLDCEYRIKAAAHFLVRAREDSLTNDEHIWYTQATVVFVVAAVENVMYDYAERKKGNTIKSRHLELDDFKQMLGSQTDFYDWLEKKEIQEPLYGFLRTERNLILHRGEPNKMGTAKGKWTTTHYFRGWSQPVDAACQEFVTGLRILSAMPNVHTQSWSEDFLRALASKGLSLSDGTILAMRVEEGRNKPYILKNCRAFVRRESTDRIATRIELDEMCTLHSQQVMENIKESIKV